MARLVLLVTVYLVLCFLLCLQARDAWHHGRYGPGGLFRHVQGLVCWYLTMSLALCSTWLSQAQDARHHGRHGPQDSVEVHRCSSWTRSSTCPLVCYEWRHGPDSAEHCLAIPQLQFITVVDTPFDAQWQFPTVQSSADHRDSPVRIWWSMSLFAGFSTGAVVKRQLSFPQLQPVDARLWCAGLQVPQVRSVRRQSRFHCCCLFTPDLQYIDKEVDVPVVVCMPVVVQREVP